VRAALQFCLQCRQASARPVLLHAHLATAHLLHSCTCIHMQCAPAQVAQVGCAAGHRGPAFYACKLKHAFCSCASIFAPVRVFCSCTPSVSPSLSPSESPSVSPSVSPSISPIVLSSVSSYVSPSDMASQAASVHVRVRVHVHVHVLVHVHVRAHTRSDEGFAHTDFGRGLQSACAVKHCHAATERALPSHMLTLRWPVTAGQQGTTEPFCSLSLWHKQGMGWVPDAVNSTHACPLATCHSSCFQGKHAFFWTSKSQGTPNTPSFVCAAAIPAILLWWRHCHTHASHMHTRVQACARTCILAGSHA